ncbi:hypothetical protein [Actinomarinicola tropica]|uniref:Chemotaxis phosphatase CheX-like domain-containing protein n=1 Tax=Actinomarinicola tropica TaxID=2789776 RepID=A0A5Q2RJ85_9ACTN|nr:hypothetical protein [Actinomarinicola tropica]QGG94631.1 hypothetical protein GH723_05635 [Actinomarinicola tropica]
MRPPVDVAGPPVPIQEAVGEFVTALVGRGCAASKVALTPIEPDGAHVVAAYRDTQGRVLALSVADLDFAAGTGASLGMIPANAAHESVAAGELEETLFENYQEVANIMMSLLNSPTSPHLKLDAVWSTADEAVPDEVWDLVRNPGKRREFAVTIEGYGSGRLGIIIR